jgi:hypothetical protein
MSFLGIHILSDAALAHLKAAGHDVTTFAATEADKAVIALKSTDIGATVAADIASVKDNALTGSQKFEAVLANTLPLVLKYVTGGGLSAVVTDVEDIARSLVQSVFNDTASTKAGKVAADILGLFSKA